MIKPKKIISINFSKSYCGVDEYCINLEESLKKDREFEIIHFVLKNSDFENRLREKGSVFHSFTKKNIFSVKSLIKFIHLIKNIKPDTVIIHTAGEYYLSLFIKKTTRLIIIRHNSFKLSVFPNIFFLKRAKFIVTPSNFCKQVLLETFPYFVNKVKLIYNPVYYDETENEICKEQDNILNIGFIGRLTYLKGLDILIDSLKILKEDDIKFHLYVAGKFLDSEYESLIYSKINEIKVEKDVTFLGFIEDKKEFFKKINLLVVPSRKKWKETFGLVVIEAFINKVPVVSFNSGALPEILSYGPSGISICENSKELASAIKQFEDKELANIYVKNGYLFAKTLCNTDVFRESFKAIL